MFKLNLSEEYKTPKCKVVNVNVQAILCESPIEKGSTVDDYEVEDI